MATATRIYRIDEHAENADGEQEVIESYLIRAPNVAQAIKHVAQRFTCEVATQDDLVELAAKSTKVQDAGAKS